MPSVSQNRRLAAKIFRNLGPLLLIAAALCTAGIGLHAVRDWHRHGDVGAGFFHLHFHVGEHRHHPGLSHHHDSHHDSDEPIENDSDRSSTLTVAQSFSDPASTPFDAERPAPTGDVIESRGWRAHPVQTWHHPANPRAPPV